MAQTITLANREWEIDEDLPAGVLFDFAEMSTTPGQEMTMIIGLRDLICELVIEEEREGLRQVLSEKDRRKPHATLGEAMQAVAAALTAVARTPFPPASSSPSGRSDNGQTLPVPAASGDLTSHPPRRVKL